MRRDFHNWLDNFGRQLDRTFDRVEGFMDEVFERVELETRSTEDGIPTSGFRHHVEKSKGRVVIYVEVPGLSAEHVSVQLDGSILTVKAAAKDIVPGRSFAFERQFRVNQHVQPEHVSASVKNGLLTVIVAPPEKPKAEGRTIPVSPG